ncbi:MAG: 4-hydroxy-2-oxovalerate aldolase [bacterium]
MSENNKSKIISQPVTVPASGRNKNVTILDTTLRDGSYAIDFNFSLNDTKTIATELESAGVKQIEIGHGWGLNAESAGLGKAAHTDAEYIKAAREVLTDAKFGCFFIPSVARAGDMIMARDLGMDFIRIGNNINQYADQENYIKIAKNLGFHVSSNLLKSYVVSPDEFARCAKHVSEMGADVAVLVDSAGGMTPNEVRKYMRAAKSKSNVPLGFHGHDNLGLANANTLAAIEEGAQIVDSTLQGIGRSAGNAVTESLAMLLDGLGFDTGLDTFKLMDTGKRLIHPLLVSKGGCEPIDFILGVARFHSSFVPMVREVAEKYKLDYLRLIVNVAEINRANPDKDLVESVARKMLLGSSESLLEKAGDVLHIREQFA